MEQMENGTLVHFYYFKPSEREKKRWKTEQVSYRQNCYYNQEKTEED